MVTSGLAVLQVREKKRWGRLMKAKGDLCLMAGSPQDAHEHYKWVTQLHCLTFCVTLCESFTSYLPPAPA